MSDKLDAVIRRVRNESLQEGEEIGLKKGEKKWRAEGKEEGRTEERKDVARSMIADGSIPIQKIAKLSKLTIAEVESIRSSMHV